MMAPRIRLRQIALVGADLSTLEPELEAALGATVCFRDPGVGEFGLHNVLYLLDDTFFEVVSPQTEGTTAGRLLDKRGGDGGYMAIFETEDLPALRSRLDDAEVRVVYEAATPGITGLHLHPADVGGAIVSIDVTDTWGDWPWGGPDWRQHQPAADAGRLCGVTIQAENPDAMAARWAEVLGIAAGSRTLSVDDATLTFIPLAEGEPDRGEGICGISCLAKGRSEAGTKLQLGGVTLAFI